MPLLTIDQLSKRYGGVRAADDVSFGVGTNTITALIGPNGAGKSTVFNLISGFESPDRGSIVFNGKDIRGLPPYLRARLGVSRTFQTVRIPSNLLVREFLELAQFLPLPGRGRKEVGDAVAQDVLTRVGLPAELLTRRGADLSYGQSKLLSLAAALLHPHQLLMLDEPVAGVNPVVRGQLKDVLRDLRAAGETILLIEHDMNFVMDLADRVVVMEAGKIIADGAPVDVQRNPDVLEAYLGEQL